MTMLKPRCSKGRRGHDGTTVWRSSTMDEALGAARAGAFDLLLVGSELAPRMQSCGIVRDYRKGKKPSDHAPLVAELDAA